MVENYRGNQKKYKKKKNEDYERLVYSMLTCMGSKVEGSRAFSFLFSDREKTVKAATESFALKN